jgi:hypothetical protein
MPFWLKHSSFVPQPPSLRVLGLGVFGSVVSHLRLPGAERQTLSFQGGGVLLQVQVGLSLWCLSLYTLGVEDGSLPSRGRELATVILRHRVPSPGGLVGLKNLSDVCRGTFPMMPRP